MSSTKENFNKAVFDMFGVGKDPDAAEKTTPAQTESKQNVAETSVAESPAVQATHPAAPANTVVPVTYLAPGTVMEGKLSAKGDVEVSGNFKGDITAQGKVILHSSLNGNITAAELVMKSCRLTGNVKTSGLVQVDGNSAIEGDIHADELICSGKIKGNLTISGNTSLLDGAVVEGAIITGTIVIECGATASGELHMGGKK